MQCEILGEKLSSMLYKDTAYNVCGNMGTRSPVIAYHTAELAGFKVGVVELLVSQNINMIKPCAHQPKYHPLNHQRAIMKLKVHNATFLNFDIELYPSNPGQHLSFAAQYSSCKTDHMQ